MWLHLHGLPCHQAQGAELHGAAAARARAVLLWPGEASDINDEIVGAHRDWRSSDHHQNFPRQRGQAGWWTRTQRHSFFGWARLAADDEGCDCSPLLGIDVPIQVDVSGHLVIAIDEYPKNGWPPGLTTTSLDLYPEAVFAAGRHRPCEDGDQPDAKRAKKKERQSSTPSASTSKTYFIPNFIYEPNLDTMDTDITKGPCSVPADYWEYDLKKGIVIRHHCRPRCSRFHPEEAHDRPDTSDWMSHRVTCVAGTSPVLDDWRCPFVDWADMFFHETFRCESTTPITTNFWSCGDI